MWVFSSNLPINIGIELAIQLVSSIKAKDDTDSERVVVVLLIMFKGKVTSP
ncbi:12377_t:CDS:2 [Funneliformis geosporum]|nr:12377_t:CDS:2 [Funneliformis geosporum]